jgi:hypothetical protein
MQIYHVVKSHKLYLFIFSKTNIISILIFFHIKVYKFILLKNSSESTLEICTTRTFIERIKLRRGKFYISNLEVFLNDKQGKNTLHMKFKIRMKESLYFGP